MTNNLIVQSHSLYATVLGILFLSQKKISQRTYSGERESMSKKPKALRELESKFSSAKCSEEIRTG